MVQDLVKVVEEVVEKIVPNYPYRCLECGRVWEDFSPISERLNQRCVCGCKANIDFGRLNSFPPIIFKEFRSNSLLPGEDKYFSSKNKYKDAIKQAAEQLRENLICKAMDFETGENQ